MARDGGEQDLDGLTSDQKEDLLTVLRATSRGISRVLEKFKDELQADRWLKCREASLVVTKLEEAEMWVERKISALKVEMEEGENE